MVLMITAMIVVMILEINFPDENGMVTSRNSVTSRDKALPGHWVVENHKIIYGGYGYE